MTFFENIEKKEKYLGRELNTIEAFIRMGHDRRNFILSIICLCCHSSYIRRPLCYLTRYMHLNVQSFWARQKFNCIQLLTKTFCVCTKTEFTKWKSSFGLAHKMLGPAEGQDRFLFSMKFTKIFQFHQMFVAFLAKVLDKD